MNSKTNKSSKNILYNLKIKQEPPDEQPFSPASQTTESSQLSQTSQKSQSSQSSVRVKLEPIDKLECMKKSLELNLKIRGLLEYEVAKMENLLVTNREKQAILKRIISEDQLLDKSKPLTQIRAISIFAAPYFRDLKKMVPPPNEDTLIKIKSHDVNAYLAPPRPWTPAEHKKLLDGITAYALLAALQPLKRDKDYIKRKMKDKNATDDDIEELKQELYICEQKIKLTNEKSLLELLSMLSGNIDWMTVSATNMEGIRTPEECENMWYNVLGFHINKEIFSEEEDNKLIDLAEEFKDRNWDIIAAALKTQRTAIQCFERYQTRLSSNLKKKYWTKEEDDRLIELVEEHKCGEIIPWNKLSLMMEGRTRQQIINRFERSISQRDNRFAWSPEEDGLLVGLYQKYGAKWNKMGSYFKRRSTYAIRERYCNALIPNVRVGPWSQEEDKQLISLIRKYGYGRWAKICRRLKGRTDNMCLIRAGRLLEWSIKYHNERGTGEYDPNVNDPLMFAKILRPCAPSKYCPIRNERLRSYRENGLKMLVKALETVAPEYKAGIHDLESVDVSWMSSEMLHKLSHVLHTHLAERKKQEMNPVPPLKYITKPLLKRKRGEPEPECDEATYFKPPERDISREEKELVDSALYMMFDMQSDITPNVTKKTQNFGSRQCAEMSLYKAYLYKQFHCKALCDEDDDLDHVVFAKVDYRETLQTVSSYFIQPPVYDNQFIVLAPNLTTMLGIEAIQATENRLLSMSEFASHSKPYIDYLCERRKCCPRCLQCLRRSGNITSSATPESIMANMNKKSFLLDEKLENAAYIESASTNTLHTSCTCKSLEYSQKSVQLLRKRFLSLFLWPSLFSSVEFGKEQQNVIINESVDDDYSLDPMDSQGSKENHQKRKRKANPIKQTRKKRKPNEPVNERDADDPEPAPNPEPKPKRKRTQLKIRPSENITSQQILRRSHRSSVLNRTSFAFTKRKGNKSTPKTSQELTAEEIPDNVPLSADSNLSQIPEENKSVTSSMPEKKNRRKSCKPVKNTGHELSVMEITSDSMVPSADGISNSIHLSEKDNTSPLPEKRNERRSRKSAPKSSNELVSEIISNDISPSVKKTNLSHLPEENRCDTTSLPEKTNKRKSRKSSQKTNHELSVSEIISQNVLPLADEINNSSQLPKENRCDILSLPEKTYRSRKSTSKTNESSISEIIPSDLPPSTDENDALSQLPKESRYDVVSLPEKKNRFRNGKSKTKANHESSVSEIISHDMPSSANEINSSSQLPKENRSDILSLPKKKYRSRKSTSKTNESSISEIIPSDLPPSTDENDALSQLPKESRCDVVSLPEKKNRFRNGKSKTKTNHESSVSEITSHDMLSSANEINSSSQLPKENRCDLLSLPKKKYRSRKSTPKTNESSISEIISSDLPPSTDENDVLSQLPKESRYDVVSLPEKKNRFRNCKSKIKTNHESSVSEIISHDMPSSANEITSSPQLPEGNKCDILSLPERKHVHRSRKTAPKTSHESSVSEINSYDISPSANENNSSSQLPEKKNRPRSSELSPKTNRELSVVDIVSHDRLPSADGSNSSSQLLEENRCKNGTSPLPRKRNTRKSKPTQKTSHELPVIEVISDISTLANRIQLPQENEVNTPSLPERNKRKSGKPIQKTNHDFPILENTSNNIPTSTSGISDISTLEEKRNNLSTLLDEIKTMASDLSEKNMDTASASLDENRDSGLLLSKKNKSIASILEDKKGKNIKSMLYIPDESRDKVFEKDSIDSTIILPEDDTDNASSLQNEGDYNGNNVSMLSDRNNDDVVILPEENSICVLSPEKDSSPLVIQDEIEIASDVSSLTDDNRDSVLPLSEGNSILLSPEECGNSSSVIQDKEEVESDISPPDSVLPLSGVNSNVSSPAFQDRNSDSVAILEERSTSIMPEEVVISSDSSGDHHQDSESEAQEIAFNSVLELSEKNICFK